MAAQCFLQQKETKQGYKGVCPCGCGTELDTTRLFASFEEANAFSAQENLQNYVAKIFVDDSWIRRETGRFESGEYENPVWWNLVSWNTEDRATFVHVSKEDPQKLAYTASPEKGMADIQVQISPGKYLKKFYGDKLTSDEIENWASLHRAEWGETGTLLWANTPEEMEQVYQMPVGFESCMQKPKEHFSSVRHPVAAYGAGDLSIAYLKRGSKLLARALVWRDKKLVGRVYGDGELLRLALRRNDIETTSSRDSYATFEGAKLLKIPNVPARNNNVRHSYVLPYIDGTRAVSIKKDHIIIDSSGKFAANTTSGFVRTSGDCPTCADAMPYTDDGSSVHSVHTANGEMDKMCSACVTNLLEKHEIYQESHHMQYVRRGIDEPITYYTNDVNNPKTYSPIVSGPPSANYFIKSAFSGKLFRYDVMHRMGNGEMWGTAEVSKANAFKDNLVSPAWYPNSMKVEYFDVGGNRRATTEELAKKHLFLIDPINNLYSVNKPANSHEGEIFTDVASEREEEEVLF